MDFRPKCCVVVRYKIRRVTTYTNATTVPRICSILLNPVKKKTVQKREMSEWEPSTVIGRKVRIGGGGPRQQVARTQGQINEARRSGMVLSVDKKYGTTNSKSSPEGQRLTKVDRETDIVKPKKIDVSVGKAIQKGRQDKNLTQKDLATKINEKPTIVNDYESGRGIPNQQILGKMERALGIKLRGKNIGEPLGGPKK